MRAVLFNHVLARRGRYSDNGIDVLTSIRKSSNQNDSKRAKRLHQLAFDGTGGASRISPLP